METTESSFKRKRTDNFSKSEEKILIETVKKFANIIECKKTDAVSNKDKNAAWKKIENCFNVNSENYRTAEQLKTKYLNLKKQCKKNFAEEKKIKMGTGGGPFLVPKTSIIDEDIRKILGSQVTGMKSSFDNDLDDNVFEYVPDPGTQSEVMFESDNEYYEITDESTECGNLKESLCEIAPNRAPNPRALKELVDNNTGYEKLEDYGESENTDSFVCDEKSQWRMLKKPLSKELKPNSKPKNTASHEKPLRRPSLQTEKSEGGEKSKKRGQPDPLKQKLSKWAESKSNLVDLQKKYYEEEHKKRMEHLEKKNALELQYMKEEHEARMKKILGSK